MAQNVNSVTLVGNLTRKPELRHTGKGTAVTTLRLAVNDRRPGPEGGDWIDVGYFFDVIVWAGQAEACANHLDKGRQVAVQGKLTWREFEHEGVKRQSVEVVADRVQFLGSGEGKSEGGSSGGSGESSGGSGEDALPF
jgi:single-strand DNA-binding protein